MILNISIILLGSFIFLYSFFEVRVWGSLFFDRDVYCIEKYRKLTKETDLVSCFHNITQCIFGFTLLLIGMRRWINQSSIGFVNTMLIVSFVFIVLDILIMEGASRVRHLRELRLSIEQQWKSEKRITPEHDHEVNLYRGLVRVTQKYPKYIIAMGIGMLLLLLFALKY